MIHTPLCFGCLLFYLVSSERAVTARTPTNEIQGRGTYVASCSDSARKDVALRTINTSISSAFAVHRCCRMPRRFVLLHDG